MSSLPLRVTGFWCPWSFVVGSFVCGSWIALLCVCSVSDGRSSSLRLVESVFLVSSHRLLVLWVSFRGFVVHIGFLGLESCGGFEFVILVVRILEFH
mgnify:CR=1 FL=1